LIVTEFKLSLAMAATEASLMEDVRIGTKHLHLVHGLRAFLALGGDLRHSFCKKVFLFVSNGLL